MKRAKNWKLKAAHNLCNISRNCTGCTNKKTIPLEKFIISVTVTDIFTKFKPFTEEDSGHI